MGLIGFMAPPEESTSKAIDNATRPLGHYEISAGSKPRRCAALSRTARFNAIRSL